ncbi:MAG: isoaspartyl peptidase/L-asparaginase, partial [Candidatus Helarchaeota archaeon]
MICSEIINDAAEIGLTLLKKGKSALDVIEKIINFLESSGQFNAGIGSVKQSDGCQRMDAAIMCSDLRCGGVLGIPKIKFPISVARKIMENTKHIYLFGNTAFEFGKKFKIPEISKNPSNPPDKKIYCNSCETVGAVALDKNGMIVAGTSTGGLSDALAGRVGDSPIIGAGLYTNEFGGVSCTGIGEDIIRTTLARYAIYLLEKGNSAQASADLAIEYFKTKSPSFAGLIILSAEGEYGISHNGRYMNWKYLNYTK